MGVFEWKSFESGTYAVLEACVAATQNGAVTIVGGGDTATAVAKWKSEEKVVCNLKETKFLFEL